MNITEAEKKIPIKNRWLENVWKNNQTNALNDLYIKEIEIWPAYISKINCDCEKKIVLMIPNEEKKSWHYFPVKKLSPLLKVITWPHDDGFYCLSFPYSFRTK